MGLLILLKCPRCKLVFWAEWVDDEIQTICDECWSEPREAKVIPFQRPA